jgi:hypothetical protein
LFSQVTIEPMKTIVWTIKQPQRGWEFSLAVEHLPGMFQALKLYHNFKKKKKKKKKRSLKMKIILSFVIKVQLNSNHRFKVTDNLVTLCPISLCLT